MQSIWLNGSRKGVGAECEYMVGSYSDVAQKKALSI